MRISIEQFKDAIAADGVLRARDLELLRTHYGCRNCSATAGQLCRLLGYQAVVEVNGAFGRLGHRVADFLRISSSVRPNETIQWWAILAEGVQEQQGFVWTLREELVSALIQLRLLENVADSYADEVSDYPDLFEGAIRVISVNAYERNPTARALCIQHYGPICVVCGFNFGRAYGEIGKGFIHVHHLLEISQIGGKYRVDPVTDLRPVCPNCHAMLHRRRPAFSIDEIRKHLNPLTN
ncbi:MAG: HNH endonuclease [Pedosphaera sp.]|nr:HNH endonuclease [Pedosphaera sp.]